MSIVRFPQNENVLLRMDPCEQFQAVFEKPLIQYNGVSKFPARVACLTAFCLNIPKTLINTIAAIFMRISVSIQGVYEIFEGNIKKGFIDLCKLLFIPISLAIAPLRFIVEQIKLLLGATLNPKICFDDSTSYNL